MWYQMHIVTTAVLHCKDQEIAKVEVINAKKVKQTP